MNKKVNLALALLVAASIGLTLNACKKTTDPDPGTTTKTLNKSLLVGKTWYNKGNTNSFPLKAGGVYGVGGTYLWKNNGDTMITDADGTGSVHPSIEWKFYWSSEHEMACKKASASGGEILYKDVIW